MKIRKNSEVLSVDIENDFVWDDKEDYAVLEKYIGKDEEVDIPSEHNGLPVKVVFDGSFAMNNTIKKVVVPNSVEKIGTMSFNQCKNLERVSMSEKINRMGFFAFNDTPFLNNPSNWRGKIFILQGWLLVCKDDAEEIEIPPDVTGIADYAFYFTSKLKKVIIPPTVKSVGMRAFGFELNLDEVFIPKNTSCHWQIFGTNTHIKKLTIEKSVYEHQRFEDSLKIDEVNFL